MSTPNISPTSTTSPDAAPSRRMLLAGMLGGIGAWAASAIGRAAPTRAAVGDNLKAGSVVASGSQESGITNNSGSNGTWVVTQNGTGTAIRGQANAGTGGRFTTHTAGKYAVVATNSAGGAGSGAAIQANGGMVVGIEANSDAEAAVIGNGFYNGIEAYSVEDAGNGLYASATGGGNSYGVYGVSYSGAAAATGVYGLANADTGSTRGVRGVSNSEAGIGVEGFGGWTGVYGGTADEVGGWAGYFTADVNIDGTLFGGTIVSRVDDPASPTTRWLQHVAVESTERLRVSSGSVSLDSRGEATVQLPAWYAGLHTDARYQLTAIGAAAPRLHVSRELDDGSSFAIAGGAAGQKVSWQLTSLRNDPYARANPVETFKAKSAREAGAYQRPELYGATRPAPPVPKAVPSR